MRGPDFDTHKLKGLVGSLACNDEKSGMIHVKGSMWALECGTRIDYV